MGSVGGVRAVFVGSIFAALLLSGCSTTTGNPFAMRRENLALKKSLTAVQDRTAELQMRANSLDADNQQLEGLLAQEQQRSRQLEGDLASIEAQYRQVEARGSRSGRLGNASPAASLGFVSGRGGAEWLPVASISGANVFRDGNVVRIRLSNTNLFDPGRATLKRGAYGMLNRVASTIKRDYAGLRVGVEGHTDGDPIRKSKWKHNHALSVERAMAVYDYLRKQGGVPTAQLFVAGYGPNEPIASNTSSANKAKNRRVELVIYPEHIAQR